MDTEERAYSFVLAFFVASPFPIGMAYELHKSADAGGSQLHFSEKMGLVMFDFAKIALLVWGMVDVFTNNGVNVPTILIPYIFCATSSFTLISLAISNDE